MSDQLSLRNALAPTGDDIAADALRVAALFKPALDPGDTLARIDAFADDIRTRLGKRPSAARIATTAGDYLFDELGFGGNRKAFYEPANSFLDEVVRRRSGIPITLSVLYVAVGRRLGLDVEGVGFPAHFLVRLNSERGPLIMDPFEGGRVVAASELNERLRQVFGEAAPTVEAHPALLRPASAREILVRMLRNLKGVYLQREDQLNALTATEAVLSLMPDEVEELRDRGLLYRDLGHAAAARASLQTYLETTSDAREAVEIQKILEELAAEPSRLH
jgi:regulator of sirC expression with transglutaminase-like and TPR domain